MEVKLSVAPKAFTMVDQKMTFQNILHKKSSESLKTDSAFDEDWVIIDSANLASS